MGFLCLCVANIPVLDYWYSTRFHGMVSRFSTLSSFSRTSTMGDKRDAAMAGLAWPPSDRTTSNPRPMGSSDSDMTDDIGQESFAPPLLQHSPPPFPSFSSPFSFSSTFYLQSPTGLRPLWTMDIKYYTWMATPVLRLPSGTYGTYHLLQDLGPG